MNFSGDAGHNASPDIGATGIKQEDVLTKELLGLVAQKLRILGHTFTDCTPYGQTFQNVTQSLQYRCDKETASGSQFHLCIHFNACPGGHGVEAYFATARDMATKLCNEISALGFTNRGIKDGSGLYVVRNTSAPCVLLEVAFVDSADDMNLYNADTVANAIVKALTGQVVTVPVVVAPVAETSKVYDLSIPTGPNIFPIGPGYIEYTEDGRMIIHKDRYSYLSIGEDHADVYTRTGSKNII